MRPKVNGGRGSGESVVRCESSGEAFANYRRSSGGAPRMPSARTGSMPPRRRLSDRASKGFRVVAQA